MLFALLPQRFTSFVRTSSNSVHVGFFSEATHSLQEFATAVRSLTLAAGGERNETHGKIPLIPQKKQSAVPRK